MRLFTTLILFFATFANSVFAQPTLQKGDSIEDITITDYILNTPKDKNFNNKFKVLEFWATWCAPCLAAVPHLNELQDEFRKNKDLVFISMTYETPEKTKRTLERISFKTIVVSDQTKQTYKNLNPNKNGDYIVPQTVLIDDKNIVRWVGHPKDLNSTIINKFIAKKEIETQITSEDETQIETKPSQQKEQEYLKISNDTSIIKGFIIGLATSKESDQTRTFSLAERKYLELNISLKEILAKLNNKKESEIILPYESEERRYNLIYKNAPFQSIELNEELYFKELNEIKQQVLTSLNINESRKTIDTVIYNLKVADKNQLKANKESHEISKHGANDTHLIFSNVDFALLTKEISNHFKINVVTDIANKEKYDFIIQKGNEADLIKELRRYGLTLVKTIGKIEYYIYGK